jgi:hypothetical protein
VSSYAPIAVALRMSDMGFWVVTVSVSPGRRISVMLVATGLTPAQALEAALGSFATVLAPREQA